MGIRVCVCVCVCFGGSDDERGSGGEDHLHRSHILQ